MSTSATDIVQSYTGNASTTVFTFPAKFLDNDHLKVYLDGVAQTSGFTVSGGGSASGGSVTFTSAPASGVEVVIVNEPPLTQLLDLTFNGKMPSTSLENAYDKLTMLCQLLDKRTDQSIKFPIYDTASLPTDLTLANRQGKLLGFDTSSNAQVELVSRAQATYQSGDRMVFASVSALTTEASITSVSSGDVVLLTGYYVAGDFGSPIELIVEASTGGVKSHLLADGRYANLYVQDRINVNWFGAFASTSNTTDQREMIQDAIDAARDTGAREVFFPATDTTASRMDWYFINSSHPSHAGYGIVVWPNIKLVGPNRAGGVIVTIKAGSGLSGGTAVVASDPTASAIQKDIRMDSLVVDAHSFTDHAIQMGVPSSEKYIAASQFNDVSAENGNVACWNILAFLSQFRGCTGFFFDTRSQSTWSPSDPNASGLIRGWQVGNNNYASTSLTFESCYAKGCDVGWTLDKVIYSDFNSIAADQCELAYDLVDCQSLKINGGCEESKMPFYSSGCRSISIGLLGTNAGAKTADVSTYSATEPDYFMQFDGISHAVVETLYLSPKENSGITQYDPAQNIIKLSRQARVHFSNPGLTTPSRKYTNATDTWAGLVPFEVTPNLIDMPISNEVIEGGFSISGQDGKMVYLDPAFYESFGAVAWMVPDSGDIYEYQNILTKDYLIKLQSSIVYPDGNVGADFTELTIRAEARVDKWGSGTASDSGGSAVNVNDVGHGLSTSDKIYIGPEYPMYEGEWTVTKVDADNFTIPALFVTGATTIGWATQSKEGTGAIVRQGDNAGNNVFNYLTPDVRDNPFRVVFHPQQCKNTMLAKGKVVDGYTYKITDMGATTSFDGSNVFPAGTGVTFGNGSVVRISDTDHNLTDGNAVVVSGTTSYNGTKYAKVVDANTWDLYDDSGLSTPTSYVADESGDYNTNVLNNVLVAKSTGYPTDWDTDATLEATFTTAEITASADWSIRTLVALLEKGDIAKTVGLTRMRRTTFNAI